MSQTTVLFLLVWLLGWAMAIGMVMGHAGQVKLGDLLVTLLSWPVFIGFVIGESVRNNERQVIIQPFQLIKPEALAEIEKDPTKEVIRPEPKPHDDTPVK